MGGEIRVDSSTGRDGFHSLQETDGCWRVWSTGSIMGILMVKVPIAKGWAEVRAAAEPREAHARAQGKALAGSHSRGKVAGDVRAGHALDMLKVVPSWCVAGLDDCIGQNEPEMTLSNFWSEQLD